MSKSFSEKDLLDLRQALYNRSKELRADSYAPRYSREEGASLRGRAGSLMTAADWINALIEGSKGYLKHVKNPVSVIPTVPGVYSTGVKDHWGYDRLIRLHSETPTSEPWWSSLHRGGITIRTSELVEFMPLTLLKEEK